MPDPTVPDPTFAERELRAPAGRWSRVHALTPRQTGEHRERAKRAARGETPRQRADRQRARRAGLVAG